jgi:hypothetical protein
MRLFCLALVSLFSLNAHSHGSDGFSRIQGADCGVKNPASEIKSLLVRVDGSKAVVAVYNGPRNSIDPSVSRVAQENADAYSMVGFPNNNSETVVIKLGAGLQKILRRPHLVISGKIFLANFETPSLGFLSNPMTEDEDIDLWCQMAYEPTAQDLHVINPEFVQRADHPSVCGIHFRDPSRGLSWTHGCTASVIGRRELLTAAHCGEFYEHLETRVQCGSDPTWLKIARWKMNPAYRPKEHSVANSSDIAVVEMEADLTGPLLAVESGRAESEKLILEGECAHYGMGTRQDETIGLLFRSAYHFPDAFLGGVDYVKTIFSMTNMIASDPQRFLRSGDSGGPIVCKKNGAEVIVGVHSLISIPSSAALSAMTAESWDFIRGFLGR